MYNVNTLVRNLNPGPCKHSLAVRGAFVNIWYMAHACRHAVVQWRWKKRLCHNPGFTMACNREKIFIQFMTLDRRFKASRERSKWRNKKTVTPLEVGSNSHLPPQYCPLVNTKTFVNLHTLKRTRWYMTLGRCPLRIFCSRGTKQTRFGGLEFRVRGCESICFMCWPRNTMKAMA